MCGRYRLTRTDKALLAHQFSLREEDIPEYADELDNAPGSWRSVSMLRMANASGPTCVGVTPWR